MTRKKNKPTRFPGKLVPLTTYSTPKYLMFIDTETFNTITEDKWYEFNFRSGVVNYVELNRDAEISFHSSNYFVNSVAMLDYILSKGRSKQTIYIFSHNLGFDLPVLGIFNELLVRKDIDNTEQIKSEFPILGNRRFIWSVKIKDCTYRFIDTANYGVTTVEQLGKDIGLPKLKIDFDRCTQAELDEYNKRDADILQKFMVQFIRYIKDNSLGSFRYTVASQALTAYRTRFMKHDIILHNHFPATRLERECYHGARVECFRLGSYSGQEFFKLDVNSMYPYCMANFDVPIRMKQYYASISTKHFVKLLAKTHCIAKVEIEIKEPYFPYIHNKKLCFPIGRYITTLNDCELRILDLENELIRVIECVTYESAVIFKDYVEFFYQQKAQHSQENNITYRTIDKLFMNSLYGKFGQNGIVSEPIRSFTDAPFARVNGANRDKSIRFTELQWFGEAIREHREGESSYSFPGLAGAITANARMYLYSLIRQACRENVFYVDTDALIVNTAGYRNLEHLIHATKLGALKIEEIENSLSLYGSKDYLFGTHEIHKGIPRRANELENGSWEYLQFSSFIAQLNNGLTGSARAHMTSRQRRTEYDKGIIDRTTGIVSPIILG